MSERKRYTPEWLVERLAQGELDEPASAALRARLADEPDGAARLARLQTSDREILARLPAEIVVPAIERRAKERRSPTGLRVLYLVPVMGAAFVGILLMRADGPAPRIGAAADVEETRIKGDARIVVYRRRGDSVERLPDRSRVGARDLLRLGYVAAGHRFGAVLSVDGRGGVTLHLPELVGAPARLQSTGEVLLPTAYELDDAPGFERFFLITADQAFSVDRVLDAGKALGRRPDDARRKPLPLPPGLAQISITLEKGQP